MKNTAFIVLLLFVFPSLSQNKTKSYFTFEKTKTKTPNNSGVHSMWIGVKNPIRITFSDSTVKFGVIAKGAKVLNYKQNEEFSIIPEEKNIILYMINQERDTMASFRFWAKRLDCPLLELTAGYKTIKDEGYAFYKDISKLTLSIKHDPRLKKDILETPKYYSDNVKYILGRNKLLIGEYKSMSDLLEECKRGDQIIIYIYSYYVKNSFGDIVKLKCTDSIQFHIK